MRMAVRGSELPAVEDDVHLQHWRDETYELEWCSVELPQRAPFFGMQAVPLKHGPGAGIYLMVTVRPPLLRRTWAGGPKPPTSPEEFWLVRATRDGKGEYQRCPVPLPVGTGLLWHSFDGHRLVVVLDNYENGTVSVLSFTLCGNPCDGTARFEREEEEKSVELSPDMDVSAKERAIRELTPRRAFYQGRLQTRPIQNRDFRTPRNRGLEIHDTQQGAEDNTKCIGRVMLEHHVNHTWLGSGSVDGNTVLMCGERAGEDAFYRDMRLVDWRTNEVLRTIPLDFEANYIECGWPLGFLPNSDTFYTCYGLGHGNDGDATNVCFCTPVLYTEKACASVGAWRPQRSLRYPPIIRATVRTLAILAKARS